MTSVNLYMNSDELSLKVKDKVIEFMTERNIEVKRLFDKDAVLNIVIGGDGAFLRAIRACEFSDIPFLGINTGHVGFFQDIQEPSQVINSLIQWEQNNYAIEEMKILEADIYTETWTYRQYSINEFVVKSKQNNLLGMDVFFNDNYVEHIVGDGLMISTPAGSTAHALSFGGPILYPTLNGYEILAIAPLRSHNFPTLPSSIVVPIETETLLTFNGIDKKNCCIIVDGNRENYPLIKKIRIKQSDKLIKRIVLNKDGYWKNLKDKLMG